jgi:hypothetical protein
LFCFVLFCFVLFCFVHLFVFLFAMYIGTYVATWDLGRGGTGCTIEGNCKYWYTTQRLHQPATYVARV